MATQEEYPWRATLRTIVAYIIVALPVYAIGVPVLMDEVGEYLPEGAVAWLTASALFVGGLVAAVTRIMAIPSVNEALRNVGLSAAPGRDNDDYAEKSVSGSRADRTNFPPV